MSDINEVFGTYTIEYYPRVKRFYVYKKDALNNKLYLCVSERTGLVTTNFWGHTGITYFENRTDCLKAIHWYESGVKRTEEEYTYKEPLKIITKGHVKYVYELPKNPVDGESYKTDSHVAVFKDGDWLFFDFGDVPSHIYG